MEQTNKITDLEKFNKLIKQLLEKFNKLREQLLKEILNSNLSKIQKLEQIHRFDLFKIKYISEPIFSEQEEQFRNLIKEKTNKGVLIDDLFVFEDYESSEINLYNFLTHYYYKNNNNNEKITILRDYYTKDVFKVTYEELEDIIYNWCISNKAIGFFID